MSGAYPGLAVIGLDAATFSVIDPLVAAGALPHIARLLGEGSSGVLRSTTHPLTPTAWTTMVTGVNAGRHGIWDFSARDESGHHLRLANGSFRRSPAVWDHLSAAGRRVGLVNIPFTWPAPAVDGFALSGLDASARSDTAVYPASLAAELDARFGSLESDHSFPLRADGTPDLGLVRRVCEQRVELVEWLVDRYDPELLFVVFMSADHIHHLAWPSFEKHGSASVVADVYRILDDALGRLMALPALTGRDFMLVSDHGGGRLDGIVNLNAWLAAEGFLTWERFPGTDARSSGRRLVSGAYRTQRLLPTEVRRVLKRMAPGLRARALELREVSAVDWSKTRAFAYGAFGNLVVNVHGRERYGIVSPGAEYERVRDELRERALQLTSPKGDRIVAAVHRREDLFEGPALDALPDLIVEFDDYAWLGKAPLHEASTEIWSDIRVGPGGCAQYVGSHRHQGIVALAGPSCRAGVHLAASIEDVCPTILHLLGVPLPPDLDGRPLTEAIDGQAPGTAPPLVTAQAAATMYSEGAAGEVEDRLRDLGYLE